MVSPPQKAMMNQCFWGLLCLSSLLPEGGGLNPLGSRTMFKAWATYASVKSLAQSTSIPCQSLMSWDSDILASVFLTRKAVSLEAGL